MRERELFYRPRAQRDWRGLAEPPTAIFGIRIANWIGIAGNGVQRDGRLVELVARLGAANADNPLYEHVVELRMVVRPGGARERAQDQICWYLLVRVSVHGGTREMLERAATARRAEVARLLDHFLPEYEFVPLSAREIGEALAPFEVVGDFASLQRGRELWCGGEVPEEFAGTLDGNSLAEELLRYEGGSLLSLRFQPVTVSEGAIWAAQQQVLFAGATSGRSACGGWCGGLCMRQVELMQLEVVGRLDRLRSGAFNVRIELASAGSLHQPAMRMLERAAGEPRGRTVGMVGMVGDGRDAGSELASGCTCLRPRTCWARGAKISEFALALHNLARLGLVRWDDLAGKHLEDSVAALADLATNHEIARLLFLPGGGVS